MAEQKYNDSVGIVSMECYIPKLFISLDELAEHSNIAKDDFFNTLPKEMAFVSDREDVLSMALTAFARLIEKNKISYTDIASISIATETIFMDTPKAAEREFRHSFQQWMGRNGNLRFRNVKYNCNPNSAAVALFQAFEDAKSHRNKYLYHVVIATDVNEDPKCLRVGCGAVAVLIGRKGCIELEENRAAFQADPNDLFKADESYYLEKQAKAHRLTHLKALDDCYGNFYAKAEKKDKMLIPALDFWVFYAQNQTCFARMFYNDFVKNPKHFLEKFQNQKDFLVKLSGLTPSITRGMSTCQELFESISKVAFLEKVAPSMEMTSAIGNCYGPAIFMGLMSLMNQEKENLEGKRIATFSYGAGTVGCLFALRVKNGEEAMEKVKKMVENNDISKNLKGRKKIGVKEFETMMKKGKIGEPKGDVDTLVNKGAFYVENITKRQRFYDRNGGKKPEPRPVVKQIEIVPDLLATDENFTTLTNPRMNIN